MSRSSLIIVFLLLFLFFLFLKSSGQDYNFVSASCVESRCGDIEIKYPFWLRDGNDGVGQQDIQHCGYQGFGLDCMPISSISPSSSFSSSYEDNLLIFQLFPNKFYVKNINYANKTVTLVDLDVKTNQTRPRMLHNLTFIGLPLGYSVLDSYLNFYFNCTRPFHSHSNGSQSHPVECLSSGGNVSYVSIQTTAQQGEETSYNDSDWFKVCEQKVVAPVTSVIKEEMLNNLGGAMSEGFVLHWSSGFPCASCESSNGRCWVNGYKPWCMCDDGKITSDGCKKGGRLNLSPKKIAIGLTGLAILMAFVTCILYFMCRRKSFASILRRKTKEDQNLDAFIKQYGSLTPKRHSYSDIKKMTNSFKNKLGHGGYGTVYEGKLSDGRLVAVKILNLAKENSEEFINEVLSISNTSHVNIVKLLGFCLEGTRKALVYEYMPNGSLEKYIHGHESSKTCNQLGMDKLYQISLGVARGLEYLHQRCNIRILHFDIKPHNILLDKDFCPKISDFGLAKQYSKKESDVSILGVRGTIGYIAPE